MQIVLSYIIYIPLLYDSWDLKFIFYSVCT